MGTDPNSMFAGILALKLVKIDSKAVSLPGGESILERR